MAPHTSVVESAITQCPRNKTVLVMMEVVVPRIPRLHIVLFGETMSLDRTTGHALYKRNENECLLGFA